jgi:predicted enzyme related to lactoylglutathione lyase
VASTTGASLRIEIFVADVGRSTAFYERALGFTRESASPGYMAMRRGDALIGIGLRDGLPAGHPLTPAPGERTGLGVEIVLEVDDVDAACRAVEAAGEPLLSPPRERPWGLRDFRLADPDGYYIRVTSRAGEAPSTGAHPVT